jgi:hypothetical protein
MQRPSNREPALVSCDSPFGFLSHRDPVSGQLKPALFVGSAVRPLSLRSAKRSPGPDGDAAALSVRGASADEYFGDIQDVKVTKDILDLARHTRQPEGGPLEPDKFEDQSETALLNLIN